MILLGDEAQVEARFSLFGNCFGHTRWDSLVTWAMWHLVSVGLETMLVSVQDRCMVCAKRTIGSKIILGAPDGNPR
jgi:hypothetical protein